MRKKMIAVAVAVLISPEMIFAAGGFELNGSLRGTFENLRQNAVEVPSAQGAGLIEISVGSDAYQRVYRDHCARNSGYMITDEQARAVARMASAGTINVTAFVDAWNRSCNYSSAVQVGQGSENGTLSASIYQRVYRDSCARNPGYMINDEQAREVARRAADETIDVDAFLAAWNRSCSYSSALEVGGM